MIPRWLTFFFLLGTSAGSMFQPLKGRCQKIEFDLCKDIPYNMTFFPNPMLGQDQQNIDSLHMYTDHFKPLILTKCHPHLKFFVCSVFAPMCPKDVPQAVTSCKSLCEQVKAGCKSLLDQYGLAWPELLECDRFPEVNQGLCMNPPEGREESASPSASFPRQNPGSKPRSCPSNLVNVDPEEADGACALPCEKNTFFTKEDKRIASSWMISLGAVNLALASFTFLTYLIDRHRFRFPERCVFFMSLCMAILSIPSIFLLFWRFPEIACEHLPSGQSYITFAGFENHRCLLSFSLVYYFSTAASLWWLMFAFTWYLSAGRRWVPEGVEACSPYVHLIAWGTAALATIVVLVMRRVDASELTGLCSVGNQDPESLLYFSLLPRLIATLLGVFFIVAGLSGMCKEGQSLRRRGTDTSKNEKLVLKMIMFCIFYLLPMCTVLVCDYLHFHDAKATSRATIECKRFGGVEAGLCKQPPRLQASRYLLQLIMGLLGGGACALWILSPKTFASWQRFLCCGMCSAAPQKTASAQRLASSSRPLIEPQIPSDKSWRSRMSRCSCWIGASTLLCYVRRDFQLQVMPHPPHPPTHYAAHHAQHTTQVWRPSNVV